MKVLVRSCSPLMEHPLIHNVTPNMSNSAVGRIVWELFVLRHVGCLSLMFPGFMLR